MDYFKLATYLARKQAADVAYEASNRRMMESFTKARKARTNVPDGFYDTQTQAQHDAEENYLMNRAESQAINATR